MEWTDFPKPIEFDPPVVGHVNDVNCEADLRTRRWERVSAHS